MIRLLAWPQLTTAAACVTAVVVVLNPVTPVLPDITVPAFSIPVGGSNSPVPALTRPAQSGSPAAVIAAPAAPGLASGALPAPAAAVSASRAEIVRAATPALVASPVSPRPGIDLDLSPAQPLAPAATTLPVVHLESPAVMLHTGDRPLPVSRQHVVLPVGPKPLPAAAVGPPDTPPPDPGALRSRVRVGSSTPDADSRGHRGPAAPD
jgi:hypothetical protein